MAKAPLIPPPDTIDPHAPPEAPPPAWPNEQSAPCGPEYAPPPPDVGTPDTAPQERPCPEGD